MPGRRRRAHGRPTPPPATLQSRGTDRGALRHRAQVFESILVAIRDPRQGVRDAAARALRACLFVIGERESRLRTWWYARVFEDALRGLQAGDSNSAHGALLAMAQLLDACDGLE